MPNSSRSQGRSSPSGWIGSHIGIVLALWSGWLALWYFCLGPNSFVMLHDTGDSVLPYRVALASAVLNGRWGYWDPQKISGIDSLSILVWPFQPDVLLTGLLPIWLAYGLMTWFQRFFAGYFTFRILKDCVNSGTFPALYGGMAYSLYYQPAINGHWGGFTLDSGLLCEAGLPFILWTLSRVNPQRNLAFVWAILLGIFVSATAWLAHAMFLIPAMLIWHFIIMRRTKAGAALLPFVFMMSWAVCSIPLLDPLLSNLALSHRADWLPLSLPEEMRNQDLLKFTYDKLYFVIKLARDNALSLGLVAAGIVFSGRRDRALTLTLGAAILFMACQLAYGPIRSGISEQLSLMKAVNFDRVYLTVPWMLIAAGSMAASHIPRLLHVRWRSQGLPLQMAAILFAIGILVTQSCYVNAKILYGTLHGNSFKDFYRNPALEELSSATASLPPFRVATVAQGVLHPAQVWVHGMETADGYVNVYPRRYKEYWAEMLSPLLASNAGLDDYFNRWGSRVYLFSPWYGSPDPRIRQTGVKSLSPKDHYIMPLLSLANVRFIISPMPLEDKDLRLMRFSVEADSLTGWSRLSLPAKLLSYVTGNKPPLPLYVYENPKVLPRFQLVTRTRLFDESQELLQALRTANHEDLASTAYLLKSDAASMVGDMQGSATGGVDIVRYSSDRIVLAASCQTDSVLIVTNTYSPFWKARINGKSTPVFPVDHTFQGLYVTRGTATVELRYDPPYIAKWFGRYN